MADNEFETVNRYRKARKIALYLRANGIKEIVASALNDYLRTALADAVDVNKPSNSCWALVEVMLEDMAAEDAA